MLKIDGFTAPYQIHLGCNDVKVPGFVNIDARQTPITDLVHDCSNLSIFDDKSVNFVYSNAFFEHLTRQAGPVLLADIFRVLTDDGVLYFSGLPDFEAIARSYLARKPGHVSPRFDLFEVYRYTHGEPEHAPDWWMEQLHKTLFDVDEIKKLAANAGFKSVFVYRYPWGREANPVNLGFMAMKNARPFSEAEAVALIEKFLPFSGADMSRLELSL